MGTTLFPSSVKFPISVISKNFILLKMVEYIKVIDIKVHYAEISEFRFSRLRRHLNYAYSKLVAADFSQSHQRTLDLIE